MATAHIEHDGNPLAKALAAFQADLPTVSLDGDNPHFKSKFTTLSNLSNVVLPKLAAHGLSFSATPQVTELGFVMEAHLIHESGERLSASFPINETNPQKVGSAVTYYRRYALAALTGVVAETDDDGNTASIPSPTERRLEAARTTPQPTTPRTVTTSARDVIRKDFIDTGKVTKDEVNALVDEAKAAGKSGAAVFEAVLEKLKNA